MRDNAEYQRLYRLKNADALRAKKHAKYLLNREAVKLRNQQRYAKNAERYRQEKSDWRAANPEKRKEIARRCYLKTKVKRRACQKRWERANPDKVKAQMGRKYQKNRLKILARMSSYERANRAKINARRQRQYYSDPAYRIKKNMSARLSLKLSGRKPDQPFARRTARLVGCNVAFLRAHLESQFKAGMSWGNYGEWEVDHRIPCASFDLTDLEQQRQCFHFSNLQPLWFSENRSKGARLLAA